MVTHAQVGGILSKGMAEVHQVNRFKMSKVSHSSMTDARSAYAVWSLKEDAV